MFWEDLALFVLIIPPAALSETISKQSLNANRETSMKLFVTEWL